VKNDEVAFTVYFGYELLDLADAHFVANYREDVGVRQI
jgi:hypothetical protein